MHYVLLKMVRGEEGYILRGWLRSFKQNFRQATLIWLLFLAAGLMALLDIWMAAYGKGGAALVLRILLLLAALTAYADFLWVFPLLSRFEGTVPGILSAAMAIAFRAFPRTLAMGAAGALPMIIWFLFPSMAPLVVLFGASLPGLISAYMYSPLFKKLEKEREKGDEDPEKISGREEDQAL
jgi:uncharacterized membrane protein YesL